MNRGQYFLLCCSIFLLSACTQNNESGMKATKHPAPQVDHSGHDHDLENLNTPDTDYGVKFTTPEGWKKAATDIPESGGYIMVEKQGEDESGQAILTIINKKTPLNTYMEIMKNQLFTKLQEDKVDFNFTDMAPETFNGMEAMGAAFIHNSGGLSFNGFMKTFHCGDKTIFFFFQEEQEDQQKNKEGIEVITKSLICS